MNTILVPLDGSLLAEQVLPYVRHMAALQQARLLLVQVVPEGDADDPFARALESAAGGGLGPTVREAQQRHMLGEALLQRARGYLDAQATTLRSGGYIVETEVIVGNPVDAILAVGTSRQVTLLALATHGYSGVQRWALGSVADKLIQAATVPVLVVRSTAATPAQPVQFRQMLVPLDGSPLALQALPLAIAIAQAGNGSLTLLHAFSPFNRVPLEWPTLAGPPGYLGTMLDEQRTLMETMLHEQAAAVQAQGVAATALLETGPPADTIVDVARMRHSDLIVMATHGYGGLQRWALGSVADKVLHATATPLLLIRAHKDGQPTK